VSRPERVLRIGFVFAWMALISYWSSQGNLPIDAPQIASALHNMQHRIAHLLAFGTLGLLARWAFDGWPRPWLLAVGLVSTFGALDEWHQSFTPGRHPGIDDWAVDTASAALALFIAARRPQLRFRVLAPAAIALLFVVGVGLAIRPSLPSPQGATFRQAAHTAIDLARSTREVARQIRSTVLG
jgi:VanZ family protein